MSSTASAPRRAPGIRNGWQHEQSRTFFRAVQILVNVWIRLYLRSYTVRGVQHIPATGGVFIIVNHTSALDPVFLCAPVRFRSLRGPGKIELFKNRAATLILMKLGIFPLRQGGADAAAVRTMVQLYRSGAAVIVFPEGGRSDDGVMKPFMPEFARLIIKLRAPLVPVGIAGARDVLPVGTLLPRFRRRVAVVFGRQFELDAFYGGKPTPEDSMRAAGIMFAQVAVLVAEAQTDTQQPHQEPARPASN